MLSYLVYVFSKIPGAFSNLTFCSLVLLAPSFRFVARQVYRDSAAGAVEAALMPWNGRQDVLIDRFDARAVLDMVPLSPKV